MEGFEVLKKKKDLALSASRNQMGYIGKYTVLKDQYSQLNNLIKKGWYKIFFSIQREDYAITA